MADEGNYRKILRVWKIDFLVLSRKIKSLKSRLFWGMSDFRKTTKHVDFLFRVKKTEFQNVDFWNNFYTI